ncbi:hypothetical protein [Clostridium sp.]|uniref:hypothetical protein n=1 Tax=Clostridium sp. TaxID=1506 RepID=UPI002FDEB11D
MKCSNRSGSLFKVIDKVNEMIEKHIKSIEVEINSVDTKRMLEIEEILKYDQKTLKKKEIALDKQDNAYEESIYTLG